MGLFDSPVVGAFVTVIGSGIFTVGAVVLNKRVTPMSPDERELIRELRKENEELKAKVVK